MEESTLSSKEKRLKREHPPCIVLKKRRCGRGGNFSVKGGDRMKGGIPLL